MPLVYMCMCIYIHTHTHTHTFVVQKVKAQYIKQIGQEILLKLQEP